MTSQQQNPNPQGYAQLSEDETNSPSLAQNGQEYPANLPQGTPVIVQGIPAMSYPAYATAPPMSHFEIYNPAAPSQIQKLSTCPYVCYKYWIALNILFNMLTFVSAFMGHHDFVSHIRGLTFFYYILIGWQIFQLTHIFIGMRDKDSKKVRKGVYMMKIYLIFLGIFYLILLFDAYEQLYEQVARQRGHRRPGEQYGHERQEGDEDIYRAQNIIAVILGVIITVAGIVGGWFLMYLLPAMKVRDILKTTPSGQAQPIPQNNV